MDIASYPLSMLIIFLIAIVMSSISTVLNKKFTDPSLMKRFREEYDELTRLMKELKKESDPDKRLKLERKIKKKQMRITNLQAVIAKQNLKIYLVTLAPFLIVFWILNMIFDMNPVAYLPFDAPNFPLIVAFARGRNLTFIGWYALSSTFIVSLLNRIFKINI